MLLRSGGAVSDTLGARKHWWRDPNSKRDKRGECQGCRTGHLGLHGRRVAVNVDDILGLDSEGLGFMFRLGCLALGHVDANQDS